MATRFMKARGLVVLAKVEFGGACTQEIKGDRLFVRWAGAGAGGWSGVREKYCWLAGGWSGVRKKYYWTGGCWSCRTE